MLLLQRQASVYKERKRLAILSQWSSSAEPRLQSVIVLALNSLLPEIRIDYSELALFDNAPLILPPVLYMFQRALEVIRHFIQ